jgi:hypothetical protein
MGAKQFGARQLNRKSHQLKGMRVATTAFQPFTELAADAGRNSKRIFWGSSQTYTLAGISQSAFLIGGVRANGA